MSCVLSFTGDDVDVEVLAALCPVNPHVIFRKGEARSNRPNARRSVTSGLSFVASEANFDDFATQKEDVIAFLSAHSEALTKMRELPGVEGAVIDFAINMRNVIFQFDRFEANLIAVVAPLRIDLELSQYPAATKSKRLKQYRRVLRKNSQCA